MEPIEVIEIFTWIVLIGGVLLPMSSLSILISNMRSKTPYGKQNIIIEDLLVGTAIVVVCSTLLYYIF